MLQRLSVSDVITEDDDPVNSVDNEHEDENVELDQVSRPHQIRIDHRVESLRALQELADKNPLAAKLWISSYFHEDGSSANGIMAALQYSFPSQRLMRKNVYPICRKLQGWSESFTWPTNSSGSFNRDKVNSLMYIFLGLTFSAGTRRRVGCSHPEYLNYDCGKVPVQRRKLVHDGQLAWTCTRGS